MWKTFPIRFFMADNIFVSVNTSLIFLVLFPQPVHRFFHLSSSRFGTFHNFNFPHLKSSSWISKCFPLPLLFFPRTPLTRAYRYSACITSICCLILFLLPRLKFWVHSLMWYSWLKHSTLLLKVIGRILFCYLPWRESSLWLSKKSWHSDLWFSVQD